MKTLLCYLPHMFFVDYKTVWIHLKAQNDLIYSFIESSLFIWKSIASSSRQEVHLPCSLTNNYDTSCVQFFIRVKIKFTTLSAKVLSALCGRKLKTQQSPRSIWIFVWGKHHDIHKILLLIVFNKLCFLNVFRPHSNAKPALKSVFKLFRRSADEAWEGLGWQMLFIEKKKR